MLVQGGGENNPAEQKYVSEWDLIQKQKKKSLHLFKERGQTEGKQEEDSFLQH